ncbi:RNA-directed DNA polymerase from mobile element jockey [Eumeta japonica]|uniref:RNA-directed DNA polymerase from mobile element jockey n=1 Tax=Eumeta variegata TaxID=151549 RepID=A0A4C1ZZK8_EUMVA|nr:RNA-directed DNA polymerase from mobile element jockey [Eumeta japonica]
MSTVALGIFLEVNGDMDRLFNGILRTATSPKPRKELNGHSITLQLIRVLLYDASEKNYGRYTVAVLLDVEKAFHKMWHNGLLHKLLDIPLPREITRVIVSFFHQRSFCPVVNEVLSGPHPIRTGVLEGYCLSPSLYATYTDDIPTLQGHLEDCEDGVILALYVNDSAYFSSSRRADLATRKFRRVLDVLPKWLDKWRMAVNVDDSGYDYDFVVGSTAKCKNGDVTKFPQCFGGK